MLWQLLLIGLALWMILERWRRRRILALAAKLPTVSWTALPLVGHTHMCLGNDEDRMKMILKVSVDANKEGGLANLWFGRQILLVVTDAACAEVVLKSCLDKNDLMNFLRDLTGNGIIFADLNIWRQRRKVMAPVFSPKTLTRFAEVFSRQSQVLVGQLEKAGGDNFSIWKYLTTYTMDAVCETNLGVNVQAQLNPDNLFLKAFERVSELLSARVCQPWLQLEMIYPWTQTFVKMQKSKSQIFNFIEDIIKRKRKEILENKQSDPSFELVDAQKEIKTFLEMLIEKSGGPNGYTDLELREEILVIAVAGTDTSAVGACFTLCMLARFPEVQKKVYQELKEVFGTSDRPLTNEDLPRLKYLEAVVKESLRLYPPVPIIVRKVEKDVELPTGHTLIPGVGVMIHIYGIHRNPRYWGSDAEQFRPERFLEPLSHPAAFVPFSNGPRNCIGYQYAMMSIKTAVSAVVRKFHVLPPITHENDVDSSKHFNTEGQNGTFRLKFDIMMKDVHGFQLRLEKRSSN